MTQNAEDTQTTPSPAQLEPTPPVEKPADDLISIDDFMKVKLRVGRIEAAEEVPKSKKLIKLSVSLGETLGTRQILAGIKEHYSPETLVGQHVVIVANLKPAKLMGLESQGMILAAASDDGSSLCLVQPSAETPLGSTVR